MLLLKHQELWHVFFKKYFVDILYCLSQYQKYLCKLFSLGTFPFSTCNIYVSGHVCNRLWYTHFLRSLSALYFFYDFVVNLKFFVGLNPARDFGGSYTVSLQNVDGSTQVPALPWNKARRNIAPVKLECRKPNQFLRLDSSFETVEK